MLMTCLECFESFEVAADEYEQGLTTCPMCGSILLQEEESDEEPTEI